METLRKRLEIGLNKAAKTSLFLLFITLMGNPIGGIAQDSTFRLIREKDEDGTPRVRKIEFWDTINHTCLRTIDLAKDNPYRSMGWKRNGGNYDCPRYELSGKLLSDLISPEIIATYNKDRQFPDLPIVVANVLSKISHKNNEILAINHSASLLGAESSGGDMSCLLVVNKQGKDLFRLGKYDRAIDYMHISESGRYLCHSTGKADADGFIYPLAIRILDISNRSYTQLEIPELVGFHVSDKFVYVTSKSESNTIGFLYYRIDLMNGKYTYAQQLFQTRSEMNDFVQTSDRVTMIEKLCRAQANPEAPMVWKDFETFWK